MRTGLEGGRGGREWICRGEGEDGGGRLYGVGLWFFFFDSVVALQLASLVMRGGWVLMCGQRGADFALMNMDVGFQQLQLGRLRCFSFTVSL